MNRFTPPGPYGLTTTHSPFAGTGFICSKSKVGFDRKWTCGATNSLFTVRIGCVTSFQVPTGFEDWNSSQTTGLEISESILLQEVSGRSELAGFMSWSGRIRV